MLALKAGPGALGIMISYADAQRNGHATRGLLWRFEVSGGQAPMVKLVTGCREANRVEVFSQASIYMMVEP